MVVQVLPLALGALLLASCTKDNGSPDAVTNRALKATVQNIVVIYAENRSFDNLYGLFPGANGIPGVNSSGTGTIAAQTDRTAAGATLTKLPQTWGGVTAAGQTPVVTQAQSDNLANQPFRIDSTFGIGTSVVTRDLYHRFFENHAATDALVDDPGRHLAGAKARNPDLAGDLAVGGVDARRQLLERDLDGELDPGRTQGLDFALHAGNSSVGVNAIQCKARTTRLPKLPS